MTSAISTVADAMARESSVRSEAGRGDLRRFNTATGEIRGKAAASRTSEQFVAFLTDAVAS
jgi:hypothetical protein